MMNIPTSVEVRDDLFVVSRYSSLVSSTLRVCVRTGFGSTLSALMMAPVGIWRVA